MLARLLILSVATAVVAAAPAAGGVPSFNLADYQHTATFELPSAAASEASAITFNWDSGNLFVLGDEGDALVEVTRTGAVVSTMTLTGFDDTEGLTYIGGGRFVMTEERLQDAYLLTYTPGGSAARSSLPTASLGPTVGNIGIEGISFEPATGQYFTVKEKDPQAVRRASIDFDAGTATVDDVFAPSLGVSDLSDVQVLSTIAGLIGTPDQDGLLIYSQESARLLEVSRDGVVLSEFDFAALSSSAEGVTVDDMGVVYVCDESPRVFVLTQVPAPSAAVAMAGALGLAAGRRRRGRWAGR